MEWLDEVLKGIADETVRASIKEGMTKGIGVNFIPKDKFNEVNTELKAQKDQAIKTEATIAELTGKAKTAEEKDAIIKQMTADNEAFKAETDKRILNTQKLSALQVKLATEVSPDAVDLVAGLINLDSVTYADNKITNYDDVVKPVREARASLFKTVKVEDQKPGDRKTTDPGVEMTDAEYYASLKTPSLI